jgi:exodeoxyribonuclease VII large subunit
MESFGELSPPVLQVSQLNRLLRELIENEQLLQNIWIAGEISNFTRATSGHLYFTLKDQSASLKCAIWKGNAMRLRMNLRDGMSVEAHGAVSIYEARGECQLIVDALRLAGEGTLFQEFLRRKALLESEGLFDLSRKLPVPSAPLRIGVVTSPSGAALQDILNTLTRRYPLAEVILSPASVQGEKAPQEIIAALRRLTSRNPPDVIILARGGGSLEDLWAFNDEGVVRAVSESPVPIVTGVGHETDYTLCDFAADLRAPTPTAAAELVSPDIADLRIQLANQAESLSLIMGAFLDRQEDLLSSRLSFLRRESPRARIENDSRRLDELTTRWQAACRHSDQFRREKYQNLFGRLGSLNPASVLKRGYAVIRVEDGSSIRSIRQVVNGQHLEVEVTDGTFDVQVNSSTQAH